MKTELEKKLFEDLKRSGIGRGTVVIIAASGGADSSALLDAIVRIRHFHGLPGEVIAAHLNHQLRGEESDGDELHVRQMAERLGLRLFAERVNVSEILLEHGGNLEAAARKVRYDFLQRIADENRAGFVLTAHTRDDQVETLLMRLLRGSGADGLRGIHHQRPLGATAKLLRSMLAVTRAEVLDHCDAYQIGFRTDSSNLSPKFKRNRIRHQLVPLMRELNPRFDEALTRAADLLADDDDFIDSIAGDLYHQSGGDGSALLLEGLVDRHPALRRRVLRIWLDEQRGDLRKISFSHLASLDRLLISGRSGKRVELPFGFVAVRQSDSIRLLSINNQTENPSQPLILKMDSPVRFGNFLITMTGDFSAHFKRKESFPGRSYQVMLNVNNNSDEPENAGLMVRARRPGDSYTPLGKDHKIKLKTLMIRHKIPVSLRDTYPVIASLDGRVIWSPGLPPASEFSANTADEHAGRIVHLFAQEVTEITEDV